jgi:hypothetical protein
MKRLKGPPIGFALAMPSNSKTRLERAANGKPSSLLGFVISDEGKKFYDIDTWREYFAVSSSFPWSLYVKGSISSFGWGGPHFLKF